MSADTRAPSSRSESPCIFPGWMTLARRAVLRLLPSSSTPSSASASPRCAASALARPDSLCAAHPTSAHHHSSSECFVRNRWRASASRPSRSTFSHRRRWARRRFASAVFWGPWGSREASRTPRAILLHDLEPTIVRKGPRVDVSHPLSPFRAWRRRWTQHRCFRPERALNAVPPSQTNTRPFRRFPSIRSGTVWPAERATSKDAALASGLDRVPEVVIDPVDSPPCPVHVDAPSPLDRGPRPPHRRGQTDWRRDGAPCRWDPRSALRP